ncbi:MAG TPA: MBL fold metallo-hydrolase [Vicinamibacteria bacterium]|jgi:glyoxylase-like metal-dependent hydrolase (beta-lactamase superfamily II)
MRYLAAAALALAPGAAAAQDLFDLRPVRDGVFAAIARPQPILNSNAAVVVLEDGVLVVDTHSKPSAARALMAQIRGVTGQPVRWVVDTHFHWDHYQGNEAYPSAWPGGVEIIASQPTRDAIESRGVPRVKHEIATLPGELERLRGEISRATATADRDRLQATLRAKESYLGELRAMQVTLPSLTFERSLVLYRRSKTVQILWLGRGHTDGDVVVYVPQDKVLMTGDLIHGWMPWMGDAHPYDWIRTLEAAERLDFDTVLSGHGDVIRGKEVFGLWRSYLGDLMAETARAYGEGAARGEARRRVADALRAKYAGRFGEERFADAVPGNVDRAWRVVSGTME